MGRKKRKTLLSSDEKDDSDEIIVDKENDGGDEEEEKQREEKKSSSGYAMTSHSGEIIQEDIYVSDGSESDDEEENRFDIVLVGSRMGLMRRGLHHASMLVQPNRQWARSGGLVEVDELTAEQRRQQEEEELAKLDPAERAARLLQEKQRKLEEAKELARLRESEENAGRDSMLFSKRTAFDIRFDQIEDKPWLRGTGELSDFFNYGLSEEEWLEYSALQLKIRQELIDASKQKRKPDPSIVPVIPRALEPTTEVKSAEISGEIYKTEVDDDDADGGGLFAASDSAGPSIGPSGPDMDANAPLKEKRHDVPEGVGGAWGAGAAPGSVLAKLIEEQERLLEDPNFRQQGQSTETVPGSTASDNYEPQPDEQIEHYQEDDDKQKQNSYEEHDRYKKDRHHLYDDRDRQPSYDERIPYPKGPPIHADEYGYASAYPESNINYGRPPPPPPPQVDSYYGGGEYYYQHGSYPPPVQYPPPHQHINHNFAGGFRGRGGRGYDRYGSDRGGRGGRGEPPWDNRGFGGTDDNYGSRKRFRR